MTIKEIITKFLAKQQGCVATLKEIYNSIDKSIENGEYVTRSTTVHDSARCVIYRNPDTFVKFKGMYMLKTEKTAALLIEGDSRSLSEIEDSSIDCIITDHPWEDKKAHKSGNQKHFADYNTFEYTPEDFKAKSRVLKDGCFLVEFLPVESSTNYRYLYRLTEMAAECGLNYYTSCIWRNAPEGAINTGKTTKGVQQIVIFSKGKPRKLSRTGVNAYQTKEILNYEIEMFLKSSEKVHQAEKPIPLYEYLIRQLTEEHEICLDQFGGSCNMLKAALNLNRFAIVYELSKEFVKNAVKRFGAVPLVLEKNEEPKEEPNVLPVKATSNAWCFSTDDAGQLSFGF